MKGNHSTDSGRIQNQDLRTLRSFKGGRRAYIFSASVGITQTRHRSGLEYTVSEPSFLRQRLMLFG